MYAELYDEAAAEADSDTLGWLVSAGRGYHNLRRVNTTRVRIMSALLTLLGVLMVLQTVFGLWLSGRIDVDGTPTRPTRPDQDPDDQDRAPRGPRRLDSSGASAKRPVEAHPRGHGEVRAASRWRTS